MSSQAYHKDTKRLEQEIWFPKTWQAGGIKGDMTLNIVKCSHFNYRSTLSESVLEGMIECGAAVEVMVVHIALQYNTAWDQNVQYEWKNSSERGLSLEFILVNACSVAKVTVHAHHDIQRYCTNTHKNKRQNKTKRSSLFAVKSNRCHACPLNTHGCIHGEYLLVDTYCALRLILE